jgi:hypothetical protein
MNLETQKRNASRSLPETLRIRKKAFQSIINEKKDVFVYLTTDAGNHLFITPLPKLFDVIFAFKYLNKL